jgi:F-type H+-transporting ATPase subunit b
MNISPRLQNTRLKHQPSAAEHPAEPTESESTHEAESESPLHEVFTWINFLLLAGAVVYLWKKSANPGLRSRGEGIVQDMQQSREAIEAASKRLSVVEQKLKSLDQEIASLKTSALQEAAAEQARIQESAVIESKKIVAAAEQDIAAAAKVARKELKTYAAELAVALAEKKIESSMSPQAERGIFSTFIADLSNGSGQHGNGRKGGA